MTDKLYVDTIEPEGATTNLAVGNSGQDIVVTGNDIRANVLQDAGGNAIFTSDGSGNVTGVNSSIGAPKVLLSTQTASSSASLSFTSGIDNTYMEYIFYFINMHPATDNVHFQFQGNASGETGYNEIITSTAFEAYHDEGNTTAAVTYQAARDQAQGTAFQDILPFIGNENDQAASGELHLFNPSSTTYVKNFYHRGVVYGEANFAQDDFIAGYFNVTAAITQIQFKMSSGNIDAGTIKMYGIK